MGYRQSCSAASAGPLDFFRRARFLPAPALSPARGGPPAFLMPFFIDSGLGPFALCLLKVLGCLPVAAAARGAASASLCGNATVPLNRNRKAGMVEFDHSKVRQRIAQ